MVVHLVNDRKAFQNSRPLFLFMGQQPVDKHRSESPEDHVKKK